MHLVLEDNAHVVRVPKQHVVRVPKKYEEKKIKAWTMGTHIMAFVVKSCAIM